MNRGWAGGNRDKRQDLVWGSKRKDGRMGGRSVLLEWGGLAQDLSIMKGDGLVSGRRRSDR